MDGVDVFAIDKLDEGSKVSADKTDVGGREIVAHHLSHHVGIGQIAETFGGFEQRLLVIEQQAQQEAQQYGTEFGGVFFRALINGGYCALCKRTDTVVTSGLFVEDIIQFFCEVFAYDSPDESIELTLAIFLYGDKSEVAMMILALTFDSYSNT